MKKHTVSAIIGLALILALSACDTGLNSGGGAGGSAGGSGGGAASDPFVMSVVLYGAGAKTAARAVEAAVSGTPGLNPVFGATLDYTVTISRNSESKTAYPKSGQGVLFSGLAAGEWKLSATATLLGETVVTSLPTPVIIRGGETTTTVLPLKYDEDKLADWQDFGSFTGITRLAAAGSWPALASGNSVVEVTGTVAFSGGSGSAVSLTAGQKVVLRGSGALDLTGSTINTLFTIPSGAELIIRGPTLQKRSGSTGGSVVNVNGGTLTLNEGRIMGHMENGGRGVIVQNSGTFTMNSGTISGNHVGPGGWAGAGVCVDSSGTFTMNGGTISGNAAPGGSGSGVGIGTSATFTMNGGTISGNTAYRGGGLRVASTGTFTKTGNSSITGNTASGGATYGNAVYIDIGSPNFRYRNADAGPDDDISIPGDETIAQGTYPWE